MKTTAASGEVRIGQTVRLADDNGVLTTGEVLRFHKDGRVRVRIAADVLVNREPRTLRAFEAYKLAFASDEARATVENMGSREHVVKYAAELVRDGRTSGALSLDFGAGVSVKVEIKDGHALVSC